MKCLTLAAMLVSVSFVGAQDLKDKVAVLRIKEENSYAKSYAKLKEGQNLILWIGEIDFTKFQEYVKKYPNAVHAFEKTFKTFTNESVVVSIKKDRKVNVVDAVPRHPTPKQPEPKITEAPVEILPQATSQCVGGNCPPSTQSGRRFRIFK